MIASPPVAAATRHRQQQKLRDPVGSFPLHDNNHL
jgi:hypothetical protein